MPGADGRTQAHWRRSLAPERRGIQRKPPRQWSSPPLTFLRASKAWVPQVSLCDLHRPPAGPTLYPPRATCCTCRWVISSFRRPVKDTEESPGESSAGWRKRWPWKQVAS